MTMNLKSSFVRFLNKKYPHLTSEQLDPLISEMLLSPHIVPIHENLISQIQNEINAYWNLRTWGENNLGPLFQSYNLRKPKNYSVCMSYDFHVTPSGGLELIEINTNASFLALGLEMYEFFGLINPVDEFSQKELVGMFDEELALLSLDSQKTQIFIVDEKPQEQRLYLEFLLFKTYLKKYTAQIVDLADINSVVSEKHSSFIYNRYTDFYLQNANSQLLKNLYNEKKIELSPNPYEYFLLADKQRFVDWNTQHELPKPKSLLAVYDLAHAEKDKIWNERKNLFFKPKNAFGSKQVYKGASMSRKVFEEMMNPQYIAQQISPAPELQIKLNNEPQTLKYDLRCYAYKNKLQLVVARLYQGQTTNLRTMGGGFACCQVLENI